MLNLGSPAAQRELLIERLVGETAEPDRVTTAARALGARALPVIATSVADLLPGGLQFELESVELGRISEVFTEAGDFAPLTVAASAHSPDALLLSLDVAAVSLITGLMFGAGADMPDVAVEQPLSATQLQISALVFARIAEAINGSGTRAMKVRFPLPKPITGEDRSKHVHRDGPAARIVYRLFTQSGEGRLSVTMPQRIALAPRGGDETTTGAAVEWQSRFGGEVMRSKLMLEATIPLGRMTLGDISSLSVGQIVEMPAASPGDTRLSARDKTLFICEFGKLGQHYTVRVKHPFDPEQDFMDGILPA